MNKETNNNNEQFNGLNSNQPDIQNGYSDGDNNQTPFGTYSAIPEIFNDRNTVSQNRSIPMQKKPNNIPPVRKAQRISSVKAENNTDNHSTINKSINKAPSRGREFVEEFYSGSFNNVQADIPQKEAVKTMPETNPNINNSISDSNLNNTVNTPKRDIKYNYEALTKPDKKSTSIIIVVYILVIIMLLVGVIGFLLTSGFSKTQGELAQFLENIDIESVFADDYSMNEDADTDSTSKTLRYDSIDSDFRITVNTPDGFIINNVDELDDTAIFTDDYNGFECDAELISGYSSADDRLWDDIINPYGEPYDFYEKPPTYTTAYGEATIWYVRYYNRSVTYAFIDTEDDGMLAVSLWIFDSTSKEHCDKDYCMLKIQQILDDMLV
jgi:hypothetical protein